MKYTQLITILSILSLVFVQRKPIKLIIPGEHLGFEMSFFDSNNKALKTSISQGEAWMAIYVEKDSFRVVKESLTWDTTQNFTIKSPHKFQPLFYIQGIDHISMSGVCKQMSHNQFRLKKPFIWHYKASNYLLLYEDDEHNSKFQQYQYGVINSEKRIFLYKGIDEKMLIEKELHPTKNVRLLWVGDLNGDNEPDFYLQLESHHEMPKFELIISNSTGESKEWKRVAQFIEWS